MRRASTSGGYCCEPPRRRREGCVAPVPGGYCCEHPATSRRVLLRATPGRRGFVSGGCGRHDRRPPREGTPPWTPRSTLPARWSPPAATWWTARWRGWRARWRWTARSTSSGWTASRSWPTTCPARPAGWRRPRSCWRTGSAAGWRSGWRWCSPGRPRADLVARTAGREQDWGISGGFALAEARDALSAARSVALLDEVAAAVLENPDCRATCPRSWRWPARRSRTSPRPRCGRSRNGCTARTPTSRTR